MKRMTLMVAAVSAPLLGCGAAGSSAVDTASVSQAVAGAGAVTGAAAVPHCHSVNGLPDRHCTPGAAYTRVTQADIGRTICVTGWTARVRPPESYTENLKREQIAEYGYRDKRLHDYEEDHLIPLEIGGSPRSVRNLWPEYDGGRIPNPKDKVEDALRTAVCAHRVRLAAAQRAIARDWKTAEQVLGLAGPQPTPEPSSPAPPTPEPSATRTPPALSCSASVSNSRLTTPR